jgi:hypothetical protein
MVPLSGAISTPSLFLAFSYTKLLQMNEAIAPAEVPVIVILVALKRLNYLSRNAKWAKVLLLPLK